jgi:long-chain acyl-CoA synthetase
LNSIYEERPWLKSYLPGVPAEIEIPLKSIGDLFDTSTHKWANRTAIAFYGNEISYNDLRNQVDRLATALDDLGIKKGNAVGVLLLNSPAHVIVFYALLKIGAVINPISPAYVSREIKHQLEDSCVMAVVCEDIFYHLFEETGLTFEIVILSKIGGYLPEMSHSMGKNVLKDIYQKMPVPSPDIVDRPGFHNLDDLVRRYDLKPPDVKINPIEDIAVLPYTAGTTGKPKGVMLTHYNLIACDMAFSTFMTQTLEDGNEIFTTHLPFYHIGGLVSGMIWPILHGNTTVAISNPDFDAFLDSITKFGVTYMLGVPSFYEALKGYNKTRQVNWSDLKLLMSGGDALKDSTAEGWFKVTGVRIHDFYGMTELTGLSHGTPLSRPKSGSIGVPVPGIKAAIVDPEKDEFLSIGKIGEMAVSGPQVNKGYWKKPERAKECECFIKGVRWWRTGDLCKMDEYGYFFIYDRKKDAIKYKGLLIFAREVEDVLKPHPGIKEVAVIGVPNIKVGEDVKAIIVPNPDFRGKLSEAEIIEYCRDKITPYKIPKTIEFIDELPKTHIGKISRTKLKPES